MNQIWPESSLEFLRYLLNCVRWPADRSIWTLSLKIEYRVHVDHTIGSRKFLKCQNSFLRQNLSKFLLMEQLCFLFACFLCSFMNWAYLQIYINKQNNTIKINFYCDTSTLIWTKSFMNFPFMVHILNFDWSVFYQITVAFYLISSIVTVICNVLYIHI